MLELSLYRRKLLQSSAGATCEILHEISFKAQTHMPPTPSTRGILPGPTPLEYFGYSLLPFLKLWITVPEVDRPIRWKMSGPGDWSSFPGKAFVPVVIPPAATDTTVPFHNI